MIKLFVTRHGETEWNLEKRMQGWKDSPLTQKGLQNARLLRDRLHDVQFSTVYSSPSKRAFQTAQTIVGETTEIRIEDDLREIGMGDWEGQKQEDIQAAYPDAFHSFWNTPHLFETSNGETFQQLYNRVERFLHKLQHDHQEETVLVVTHTVFIKTLLVYCKGLPISKLWEPPYIYDTSLTILEWSEELTVVLEGDIGHLEEKTVR
ncbi:histidine phosphatase family protein [Peribacillus alkalitolerans]|uniref:histidine phosphatase family protein n=1 Tax=Peribacillus alkalitolerans TaxID=1550385 RepID=UPI0013D377B4|nr:histidine phosphatase family protein [Peribacillus alkalitolerans]